MTGSRSTADGTTTTFTEGDEEQLKRLVCFIQMLWHIIFYMHCNQEHIMSCMFVFFNLRADRIRFGGMVLWNPRMRQRLACSKISFLRFVAGCLLHVSCTSPWFVPPFIMREMPSV